MGSFAGNDFLRDALLQLLSHHYTNGYRIGSPIEMGRLRTRWREEHGGEELPASDEVIEEQIASLTVCEGGMAFLIAQEVKDWLQYIVTMYLSRSQVIFYDTFFQRHQERLSRAHIFNERILKAVLQEIFPQLHYEAAYFGKRKGVVQDLVAEEILGVWGEATLRSFEQLQVLLYIPSDEIIHTLRQRKEFLRVEKEIYTHISRVEISDETRTYLQKKAEEIAQDKPFWNIKELPIDDVLACNYELETETCSALYDAVYISCLAEDFERKSDTLTKKHQDEIMGTMGQKMSAVDRMRVYCREQDVCTLSELQEFAKKISKETRHFAMRVAANSMIRVEAERYIADKYVDFDIVETDAAIAEVVTGNYLPLKSFITFARFPSCGQPWNLFLLESYCRRFSQQFRFDVPYPNMRCAGTVIKNLCNLKYNDLLADAVFHANIALESEAVGAFLYDFGYVGKIPIERQLNEIIKLVKVRG